MKKNVIALSALALLSVLLIAAVHGRSAAGPSAPESDRAAADRTIKAAIGWALNKDFDLLFRTMAQDADFFIFHPDSKSTIVGFEAFKALAESSWKDDRFKATDFEVKDLRLKFSPAGDVAWWSALLDDHGEFDGRPTGWDNARWTGVLEKRDGRWVIAQMHFSIATDLPQFTPVRKTPYLGQTPPGAKAELFAPGLVSTGMGERDLAMTPDGNEIYYGLNFGGNVTIMAARFANGCWSEPSVASFASDPAYFYFEPCLSADGNRVMFLSTRPRPGEAPKPGWGHQNIWAADRKPDGAWGEPYDLGDPVNTDEGEFYPSLTNDGTLYFTRSGSDGSNPRIMRARPAPGGKFLAPETLPAPVNVKGDIYNAYITRDESVLIACVPGGKDSPAPGRGNYTAFFRGADDRWSEGVNLGPEVNFPGAQASSCSLSPDGEYFFFASTKAKPLDFSAGLPTVRQIAGLFRAPQNGDSDIYWIDASILPKHPAK